MGPTSAVLHESLDAAGTPPPRYREKQLNAVHNALTLSISLTPEQLEVQQLRAEIYALKQEEERLEREKRRLSSAKKRLLPKSRPLAPVDVDCNSVHRLPELLQFFSDRRHTDEDTPTVGHNRNNLYPKTNCH